MFHSINKENNIFIGSDSVISDLNNYNSFLIQANNNHISRSSWNKVSINNSEMKFSLNYTDSGKLGNLKIVKITN